MNHSGFQLNNILFHCAFLKGNNNHYCISTVLKKIINKNFKKAGSNKRETKANLYTCIYLVKIFFNE